MNLCSEGHDEVCFSHKRCPLCFALKDIEHLQKQIDGMISNIHDLEAKIQ